MAPVEPQIIHFVFCSDLVILGFLMGLVIGTIASLINMIISAFSRWVLSW